VSVDPIEALVRCAAALPRGGRRVVYQLRPGDVAGHGPLLRVLGSAAAPPARQWFGLVDLGSSGEDQP
jgi:hypothetical protein